MERERAVKDWLAELTACNQCALRDEGNRGPTRFSGSTSSPLMLVGEGPGGVEDIYGVPLVGPSGQLLDKALWSVGVTRDCVYVTNIVKCRPRGNRTPSFSEGLFCAQRHLLREIEIVKPSVIVTLWKVALQFFYGMEESIVKKRGQWFTWEGIPIMPTFHLAFLLRKVGQDLVAAKWDVYHDLKAAVEKAQEKNPSWQSKSDSITNLLERYSYFKQQRQL